MFEFVVILFAHWFADFPIQALGYNHMKNKHKNIGDLTIHFTSYFLVLGLLVFLFTWQNPLERNVIWMWAGANGILHFCVDYWTSKATNKLWLKGVSVEPIKGSSLLLNMSMLQHNGIRPVIKYNQKYVGPFWCVIGFDQMLHMICLFVTAEMLGLI